MASQKPLVSIIVPLYNREQFLGQLFSTIEGQTYTDFEFILVDDGSTDDTEAWVCSHQLAGQQPITYVKQENAGPYAARNHGLKMARGKYIAFQDSDDEWPEGHLAEFVDAMEANPDIDWLFGSIRRISHATRAVVQESNFVTERGLRHPFVQLNTELRGEVKVIDDPRAGEVAIRHCVPGSTQCALIRKALFDQQKFDPSFRTAYDRFFAMKSVLRGYRFAFVEKTHQIYHIHNDHISLVAGADPAKLKRSAETMLRGYQGLIAVTNKNKEIQGIKYELARVMAWELSLAHRMLGNYPESRRAMLEAWKLQPLKWRYCKSYMGSIVRSLICN